MDNDQIDIILNASSVKSNRLRVNDDGDLEWQSKNQNSAKLTTEPQNHLWDTKKPVVWKKRKKNSIKVSYEQKPQMISELFNLISDKASVKAKGPSISLTSIMNFADKPSINSTAVDNISSRTKQEIITPNLATISDTTPSFYASGIPDQENQIQQSVVPNLILQLEENDHNFSFSLMGDFFRVIKNPLSYTMRLPEFVAYFFNIIDKPARITNLIDNSHFIIIVSQPLMSRIKDAKQIHVNELLTTLEDDFCRYFKQFVSFQSSDWVSTEHL